MRIATGYAQKVALDGITDRQAALIKSQEQLSSGKRINRPSDDPAAAAEAEKVRSRQARMDAEKRAVGYAQQQLSNRVDRVNLRLHIQLLAQRQHLTLDDAAVQTRHQQRDAR